MQFSRAVLSWYRKHGRDLPWRNTKDPYAILVSEIMLQQTQVSRVIPKYEAFLRQFPTFSTLARASLGRVLQAWSGLGYNRRARALHGLAKIVARGHGGVLPADFAALRTLPGLGDYTAAAVLNFAFCKDTPMFDTNIRRVFSRYFFGGEPRHTSRDTKRILLLAQRALPKGYGNPWHHALMDLGALLCTSQKPSCRVCFLRRSCKAAPHFLSGRTKKLFKKRGDKKPFIGSNRYYRGHILRLLAAAPIARGLSRANLRHHLSSLPASPSADTLHTLLHDLHTEGLLQLRRNQLLLPR